MVVRPAAKEGLQILNLSRYPPLVTRIRILPIGPFDPWVPWLPAQLSIEYAEGSLLPATMDIAVNDWQHVLVRDDGQGSDSVAGDGVFNGTLDVDLNELYWQYQRIDQVQGEQGDERGVPIFRGRDLAGWVKPPLWDPEWLRARIEEGTPISLDELHVGFPQLVSSAHSLFVTHPGVVGDPTRTTPNVCQAEQGEAQKKWTFGYLMTQMANPQRTGRSPSDFVLQWLETWRNDQFINGWDVPRRDLIGEIIDQWQQASGNGNPLDMDKAPFELLAIVNRIDLAENPAYGGGTGGEGRFIFAWVAPNCEVQPFTVIFEYGVPEGGCLGLRNWAQRWKALDAFPLGSEQYNQALEDLTEVFARADAATDKPNGSALNQLRTNEIALGASWQLREFKLPEGDGPLTPVTVHQTPDTSLNGTLLVTDYLNAFAAGIRAGQDVVPLEYQSVPFLGGASDVPSPSFFWRAANETAVDPRVRHTFSLNTCSGCHAGETGTSFTHINPETGALSGFLTGMSMSDPADASLTLEYGDLAFRAARLDSIANQMCLLRIKDFRPLTH